MSDTPNPPCATCGSSYPPGDMTTCDECGEPLCPYDARTITSEDVVCPKCHEEEAAAQRLKAYLYRQGIEAWPLNLG